MVYKSGQSYRLTPKILKDTVKAFADNGGNVSRTAKQLDLTPRTLRHRLEKIEPQRRRQFVRAVAPELLPQNLIRRRIGMRREPRERSLHGGDAALRHHCGFLDERALGLRDRARGLRRFW